MKRKSILSRHCRYEKGAFTGAVAQKRGRLEVANGGTLFLDEVGDLTPATQSKLLRVLQERQFERVGGTRTIDVDVRTLPQRTGIWKKRLKTDHFVRISTIVSTSSR